MKLQNYSKIVIAFILFSSFSFAQKTDQKEDLTAMITSKKGINKQFTKVELDALDKGELIKIYDERFTLMLNFLPQIGFTFKPGQTLKSLGIPENSTTKDATETYNKTKNTYVDAGKEFHTNILPYADKSSIIAGIMFYEDILRNISAALQN